MKKYLYILCLCVSFFSAKGQIPFGNQSYVDSLKNQLNSTATAALKANSSFLLSEYYLKTDSTKAKSYLLKGINYSKDDSFLRAVALYYQALVTVKDRPGLAKQVFLKADSALQPFHTKEAFHLRSMCWHNYAFNLYISANSKEAVDVILHKAIPLILKSGDQGFLGKNYYQLSIAFKDLHQFDKEKIYLEKALSTLKTAQAPHYLAMVYQSVAENDIALGKLTAAEENLEKLKALLKPYPKSAIWLEYYATEALRYNVAFQYDSALMVIDKGMLLTKEVKGTYAEQRLLLQKFYAMYSSNQFVKAKDVALILAQNKQFMVWDSNKLQVYNGLAMCYEGLKDKAKAFDWLKLYNVLNDSINNNKLKETVNLFEVKYRTEENQKKMIKLNAENAQAKLATKNSRLLSGLLGSTSLFLLILAILGWLFYNSSRKLTLQKDLNHQQQLKDLDNQQQLKIAEVMLAAKEEEQNRVARDLHDGLGGTLSMAKMNLDHYMVEKKHNKDIELRHVIFQLENSITELRQIAYDMMPGMLSKLGLQAALNDLCESLTSEKVKVYFQCLDIKNTITEKEQLVIYRIAQEALTNAVKHASAKNILLQCSQTENIFFMTIEDDGKGFNPAEKLKTQGFGLSNIQSRVAYLKGKIEILSVADQQGTSINIELNVTS
ncbi:ATP-binding protein [Pedobacter sp. UC225_65]|uniref:ATP-binding protein n=1 Tax=Pedobacter sp. UC225_65 TaxID=3350173 RepID=UPI00366F7E61